MGLTKQQVAAVRGSWAQFVDETDTHGPAFYMRWFRIYPALFRDFKPLFKHMGIDEVSGRPELKAQGKVFTNAISTFVEKLDDEEYLSILVQKVVRTHSAKGISVKDMKDMLVVLVSYLQDTFHMDTATKAAWDKAIAVFGGKMDALEKD